MWPGAIKLLFSLHMKILSKVHQALSALPYPDTARSFFEFLGIIGSLVRHLSLFQLLALELSLLVSPPGWVSSLRGRLLPLSLLFTRILALYLLLDVINYFFNSLSCRSTVEIYNPVS